MMKVSISNENERKVRVMGCRKMEDALCLQLGGMQLQTLSPDIFECMRSLEELDVSNNNLKTLDLPLTSRLIRLNCSHNELSDVHFLCSFPNLEELHIDGNPGITFADRYIAACLCPRLKCLDNINIFQIDDLNKEYEEKLWPQVVSVWQNMFAGSCEPAGMTDLQFAELRGKFTDAVFDSNLYGEDELEKFRDFKVKNMITEVMMTVRSNKHLPSQPTHKAFVREFVTGSRTLMDVCRREKKLPEDSSNLSDQSQVVRTPDDDQSNVVVQLDDKNDQSDDEIKRIRPQSSKVIKSCTPSVEEISLAESSTFGSKKEPINKDHMSVVTEEVSSVCLSGPVDNDSVSMKESLDFSAAPDILSCEAVLKSPRKLQVTLKKLSDNEWIRTSPSPVKSPSEKCSRTSSVRGSRKPDVVDLTQNENSKPAANTLRRKLFRRLPSSSSEDSKSGKQSMPTISELNANIEKKGSSRLPDETASCRSTDCQPTQKPVDSPRKSPRKLTSTPSSSKSFTRIVCKSPKKLSDCAFSPLSSVSVSDSDEFTLQGLSPSFNRQRADKGESSSDSVTLLNSKRPSRNQKPHLPRETYRQIQKAVESQDDGNSSNSPNSSSGSIKLRRIRQSTDEDDSGSGPTKLTLKESFPPASDNIASKSTKQDNSRNLKRKPIEISDDDDDDDSVHRHATTETGPPRKEKPVNKPLNGLSSSYSTSSLRSDTKKMATRKRSHDSLIVSNRGKQSLSDKTRNGVVKSLQSNHDLAGQEKISLPPTKHWRQSGFYRCHSATKSAEDSTTQVWDCAFEPDLLRPGKTTHVLATCGGRIVSFLDCSTGSVLRRYRHSNFEEEFFALAWTTLTDENDKDVNILAVAGRSSQIHLIHPLQLICFASIEGNSEFVNALVFHPSCPSYLCSGHADGVVVCWDISMPTLPDFKCECRKLFSVSTNCTIQSLAFTLDGKYTLSGCEGGCFGWPVRTGNNIKSRTPAVEFVHPLNGGEGDEVDSIVVISSDIVATKVASRSCIYLWDLNATLQSKVHKRSTQKLEILLVAILEWSPTQDVCMRMGYCTGASLLACGDSSGKVWLYKLDQILKKRIVQKDVPVPVYSPSKVLLWPKCMVNNEILAPDGKITMNKTALTADGKYLAAVTDHNLVCIWK